MVSILILVLSKKNKLKLNSLWQVEIYSQRKIYQVIWKVNHNASINLKFKHCLININLVMAALQSNFTNKLAQITQIKEC